MISSSRSLLGALALVALGMSACGPSAEPETAAAVAAVASAPATVANVPLLTVKIATYNILVGAGWDRALDDHVPEEFKGVDRTALLIEYLRQLDADIVGLQETTGWDQGSPPYIEAVANQLGMNYVVSTGRSDSSLLTKLEILEAEDLSNDVNSIVRVRACSDRMASRSTYSWRT